MAFSSQNLLKHFSILKYIDYDHQHYLINIEIIQNCAPLSKWNAISLEIIETENCFKETFGDLNNTSSKRKPRNCIIPNKKITIVF